MTSWHFILGPAPHVGQRTFNASASIRGPDFIPNTLKYYRVLRLVNFDHIPIRRIGLWRLLQSLADEKSPMHALLAQVMS